MSGTRWIDRASRLRWYAARIAAMSPAEIAHRIRELDVKRRWRRAPEGLDETIGDGPIRGSATLRARLAKAADLDPVRVSAARTRAGRVRFFGRDWPVADWSHGAGPDFWLHDPVTGRRWPGAEAHFLDVDLRTTGFDRDGPRLGDAKFVWEPGRLQMLHPLAAAAAAGERESAEVALLILQDFIRTNPPFRGVHWTSGIELSLRLVGITLLCSACGPAEFDAEDRVLIRRLVAAHASFLAAFPSLHSSANNHRVAEGLGLYLAGRLLPDLGAAWERQGRGILAAEAPNLILADGGGAEQSLVYQAFTMEVIGFAVLLAHADGRPFAAPMTERLAGGARFLQTMLNDEGFVPGIGDDDETRVLAQPSDREPRYVASVTAAMAGLLGLEDLVPPVNDVSIRDAIFAAPSRRAARSQGRTTFQDTGYTVVREDMAGRRVHLVFDHGPLGHLKLAAHGHADALALWLSLDEQEVFIDAGTYLYHSGAEARLRERESQNHNSVVVGGVSQSRASSAFGWSERAQADLIDARDGPNWSFTATHDGYRRRFGVRHERRIARDGAAIVIADRLQGASTPLPVEIVFLAPGALALTTDATGVTIANAHGVLCRLAPPDGFRVAIRTGASEGAVRSRLFGEIEDAQRIVFAGTLGVREAVTRLDVSKTPAGSESVDLARQSHSETFQAP